MNEEKTIGKKIKEFCPLCEKNLLLNPINQKWCSNVYCRYGVDKLIEYFWGKKAPMVYTNLHLQIDRIRKRYKIAA